MLQKCKVFFFLAYLFLLELPQLANSCDLCPEPVASVNGGFRPIPDRSKFYVEDGVTCDDMYESVMSTSTGSTECSTAIQKYRNVCCYPTVVAQISSIPSAPPPSAPPPSSDAVEASVASAASVAVGAEPVCHLCGEEGRLPGSPHTEIFSNFIPGGSTTCEELYRMGLERVIMDILCYPLQLYIKDPCQCTDTRRLTRGLRR